MLRTTSPENYDRWVSNDRHSTVLKYRYREWHGQFSRNDGVAGGSAVADLFW